jgi:hypothetical protein
MEAPGEMSFEDKLFCYRYLLLKCVGLPMDSARKFLDVGGNCGLK